MKHGFKMIQLVFVFCLCLGTISSRIFVEDKTDLPFGEPSIRMFRNFDSEKDARDLRAAMKGFGTDEPRVLDILTARTYEQRLVIAESYQRLYKLSLLSELDDETSGNFRAVIRGLLKNPYEFLASELYKALNAWQPDKDAISEILCSHGNEDNQKIASTYKHMYKKSLEAAILERTNGYFKTMMRSLVTVKRSSNVKGLTDMAQIMTSLHTRDILRRERLDEIVLIDVISKLDFQTLPLVEASYAKKYQMTLANDIKSEMWNPLQSALIAVLDVVKNRPLYFANCLLKATTGRVNDGTIIRILVSRAERDLSSILNEFNRLSEKSFYKVIDDKTSGDFKKILMGIFRSHSKN